MYFYSRETKTLLPIETSNYTKQQSNIFGTLKSIKDEILNVSIYYYLENTFYTYVSIFKDNEIYEINLSFPDAMKISENLNTPIFVEDSILEECGFKVTKEMIEAALSQTDIY